MCECHSAKAGTHTARSFRVAIWSTPFAITKAGGYGSLLSQGRQRRKLTRPRQRAVDHRHRVLQSVDRDEGAEARAFFLAEQHLIDHVEPLYRHPTPPI